jgi:hypothetical protein
MSRSPQQELPLARVAGGAAVLAGALFAVAQLGQLATLDRADIVATSADPLFRAFSIAYAAGFVGLVIALAAIHVRQARAAGVFGLVGFGAAVLGTMSLGADMWFEAFASPWLVSAVPALLTIEKAPIWQVGYMSSYLLFALGWILFGLSNLRSRAVPTALWAAVVLSGAIGYFAAQPPFGVPLGLAVAAVGVWLIRTDSAADQRRPSRSVADVAEDDLRSAVGERDRPR